MVMALSRSGIPLGLLVLMVLARAGQPAIGQTDSRAMEAAIRDGSALGGVGHGWFHPAQVRFGWDWLAATADSNRNGAVSQHEFAGPARDFARLDRNHDHAIRRDDFDWSEKSNYYRQGEFYRQFFAEIDSNHDGRIARTEWDSLLTRSSGGKDHLTVDDFREAWMDPPPPVPPPLIARPESDAGEMAAEKEALKQAMLAAFARNELGFTSEGPTLGSMAPDFTLSTRDGKRSVTLSQVIGPKPVVLVFGNYSCGPFRQQFPLIDDIQRRYADRAEFLLVYIREAHPKGGWQTEDNTLAGISVEQPTDYAARVALAEKCGQFLQPSMPILVDTIDDHVGTLYSALPSRLYIIDPSGRISYKAGRGPFGLIPGEMEQALILTLLAQPRPGPGR